MIRTTVENFRHGSKRTEGSLAWWFTRIRKGDLCVMRLDSGPERRLAGFLIPPVPVESPGEKAALNQMYQQVVSEMNRAHYDEDGSAYYQRLISWKLLPE